MKKVNIYGIDGAIKEKIDLPEVFDTPYRPDIIKKAFVIHRSSKRQPYGSDPNAGAKHATASVGKGRGMSRVPRLTQGRRAALAPGTVGGRRAHPPKVEKNWWKKMNKKERLISLQSALGATADKDLVSQRGHKFKVEITLPVVIEDNFENLKKTKDVIEVFKKIGLYDDIIRAKDGKHIRAGKGKIRGRKYKGPKSLLVVTEKENIKTSTRNLSGIDVIKPSNININNLAPGGVAGRLTVFTKSSLTLLGGDN